MYFVHSFQEHPHLIGATIYAGYFKLHCQFEIGNKSPLILCTMTLCCYNDLHSRQDSKLLRMERMVELAINMKPCRQHSSNI